MSGAKDHWVTAKSLEAGPSTSSDVMGSAQQMNNRKEWVNPAEETDLAKLYAIKCDHHLKYLVDGKCIKPCKELLSCGQVCMGTCFSCSQGRLHIACISSSQKQLNVNLRGSRRTNILCNQPCPKFCSHSRCQKGCGADCDPCMEPCGRSCEHGSCPLYCHEPCFVDVCHRPCTRQLICGHMCVGFCGETPCPLCLQCFPEMFVPTNKDSKYARYIRLLPCDHCVELSSLRKSFEDDDSYTKKCPKCQIPVVNCQHMNEIKQSTKKIDALKLINVQTTEINLLKKLKAIEQNCKLTKHGLHILLTSENHTLIDDLEKMDLEHNQYTVLVLQFICIFIDKIIQAANPFWFAFDKERHEELRVKASFLVNTLIAATIDICDHQIQNVKEELNRFTDLVRFYLLCVEKEFYTSTERSTALKDQIQAKLFDCEPYSNDVQRAVISCLYTYEFHILDEAKVNENSRENLILALKVTFDDSVGGKQNCICFSCKTTDPVNGAESAGNEMEVIGLDYGVKTLSRNLSATKRRNTLHENQSPKDVFSFANVEDQIITEGGNESLLNGKCPKGHTFPEAIPKWFEKTSKNDQQYKITGNNQTGLMEYSVLLNSGSKREVKKPLWNLILERESKLSTKEINASVQKKRLKELNRWPIHWNKIHQPKSKSTNISAPEVVPSEGVLLQSYALPCGHKSSRSIGGECLKRCNTLLLCGDVCQGTCHSCSQGRVHVPCQSPCGKVLSCGHVCNVPCKDNCPPCTQPCNTQCFHRKCELLCGVPCKPCQEKCAWKCPHQACSRLCSEPCDRELCLEPCRLNTPCGHSCVGLCGEPCPPCRLCRSQLYPSTILSGKEDSEDARFIALSPCGHCIEVSGLLMWLSVSSDKSSEDGDGDGTSAEAGSSQGDMKILPKRCPACSTVITNYQHLKEIRSTMKNIFAVKEIFYGTPGEIAKLNRNINKWKGSFFIEEKGKGARVIPFFPIIIPRRPAGGPGNEAQGIAFHHIMPRSPAVGPGNEAQGIVIRHLIPRPAVEPGNEAQGIVIRHLIPRPAVEPENEQMFGIPPNLRRVSLGEPENVRRVLVPPVLPREHQEGTENVLRISVPLQHQEGTGRLKDMVKFCKPQVLKDYLSYYNQSNLSKHTLNALMFVSDCAQLIINAVQQYWNQYDNSVKKEIKNKILFLYRKIEMCVPRLGKQQHFDLDHEFHRLIDLAQLKFLCSFDEYTENKDKENVRSAFQGISSGLQDCSPYIFTESEASFQKFCKEIGRPFISDEDKKIIREAFPDLNTGYGREQTQAYMCSRGHIYFVGECGFALEKSRCHSCDEQIGGVNHQLVDTSVQVTGMIVPKKGVIEWHRTRRIRKEETDNGQQESEERNDQSAIKLSGQNKTRMGMEVLVSHVPLSKSDETAIHASNILIKPFDGLDSEQKLDSDTSDSDVSSSDVSDLSPTSRTSSSSPDSEPKSQRKRLNSLSMQITGDDQNGSPENSVPKTKTRRSDSLCPSTSNAEVKYEVHSQPSHGYLNGNLPLVNNQGKSSSDTC